MSSFQLEKEKYFLLSGCYQVLCYQHVHIIPTNMLIYTPLNFTKPHSPIPHHKFITMAKQKPLQILFFPLPSPGHIIPVVDLAKLFASRGAQSTIILTPLNASRFNSTITRSQSLNHLIKLHVIPFPSSLLPPNCESTDTLPDRSLSEPFSQALSLMQAEFDQVVRSEPPDAIVSDLLLSWTAPVANELNIPRYAFPGTGCFPLSVELSILMNQAQIGLVDEFIVPGLPNKVYLTRFKLAETTLPGEKSREFFDQAREADLSTAGLVVNSFSDLEPGYAEHYQRVTGKRARMVGPLSLCNQEPSDMVERGRGVIPPEAGRIFQFLDNKPAGSVLYVCFGSLCQFPLAQLKEIGFGLETSNVPFIWVIREGQGGSHDEWMEDFEKSVEGRGMVVKGWAPQVGILSHVAVGGFMTHCGWGSVTETVSAGVPMLTWPLFAEQFYNEILVTEVAQVGSKIGAEAGFVWNQVEKGGVIVSGEKIKEKVIWFMGNEKEVEEVRKRAKMLGERAREAVGIEGSSYKNIQLLMEDMKQRSWRVSIKKELG